MRKWKVRLKAQIDDELEIEAETEEEALENADHDWSFTEAHSWESEAELIFDEESE